MHIGEVIKEYRINHKMSLQAFGNRCGLTRGYIAMLEKGTNSKTGRAVIPSVETFMRVSMAIEVPLGKLVDVLDEGVPEILVRWFEHKEG